LFQFGAAKHRRKMQIRYKVKLPQKILFAAFMPSVAEAVEPCVSNSFYMEAFSSLQGKSLRLSSGVIPGCQDGYYTT
jgi:hypothetical protein